MKHRVVLDVPYSINNPRFKPTLIDYERDFDEQLSICQLFEKLVSSNTDDMNITDQMNTDKRLNLLKNDK